LAFFKPTNVYSVALTLRSSKAGTTRYHAAIYCLKQKTDCTVQIIKEATGYLAFVEQKWSWLLKGRATKRDAQTHLCALILVQWARLRASFKTWARAP